MTVRLLYDSSAAGDTPPPSSSSCGAPASHHRATTSTASGARASGADPAQPPQDAGRATARRLHGRPQHLQRVGAASRRGRRLAATPLSSVRGPAVRCSRRPSCGPGTGARAATGAPRSRQPPLPAPRATRAWRSITNTELRDRFAIRRAALHAIRESRTRVYWPTPTSSPIRGILRALQSAAARGVGHALLVPLASDSRMLDSAARADVPPAAGGRRARSAAARHVIHTKALVGRTTTSSRSAATTSTTARWPTTWMVVVNVLDPGHRRRGRQDADRRHGRQQELTPATAYARRDVAGAPDGDGSPTACAAGYR